MDELDLFQPDPSWDYSELWSATFKAKEKLQSIIEYMKLIEQSDELTDERLRQNFYELSEFCEECSHLASGAGEIVVSDLSEGD